MKRNVHWSIIWQEIENEFNKSKPDGVSLSFLFSDIYDLAVKEADELGCEICDKICDKAESLGNLVYMGTDHPTVPQDIIIEAKCIMDELKPLLVLKYNS